MVIFKNYRVAFLLLLVGLIALARHAERPVTTVVRCGWLLNVRTGQKIRNASVEIRGARITAVGAQIKTPPGARMIDLRRFTVIPGLIDAHTHITYHFSPAGHFPPAAESAAVTMQYARRNARDTLQAGFTTIRNLGAADGTDLLLRDAINRGDALGPRIIASGQPLMPSDVPLGAGRDKRLTAIRQFVRARLHDGVDVIKIFEGVDNEEPLLSSEEIRAAVEEAAKGGRKVAVHAHEAPAIRAAVLGGCASIEHGTWGGARELQLMAQHGTALVPTLYLPTHYLQHRQQFGFDDDTWTFFTRLQAGNLANARRARLAGVRIVNGSDAVAGLHGHNGMELQWLVKAGLTPLAAIRAATVDAAELLGLAREVGSLEPGMRADLVAVAGDPTRDIKLLLRPGYVMKDGVAVELAPAAQQ